MITTRVIAIICAALLIAQKPYVFAQAPPQTGQSQPAEKSLSDAQLDSLVAPIALYPDPLLSQILVASTYPLEIVEAARWLKQNGNLKGKDLTDAAAKQPWDASVQALVILPDVLNRLNQEVAWTTDLGNAFLAQQTGVMEAVQRMRQRASDSGVLQSTPQQTVTKTTDNNQTVIQIEPASPQVIYVPQYNPVAVWGPADYYPWPDLYYPPVSTGAVVAASAISFGVGLAVGAIWNGGWNNWGWNPGWGRNNIVINNNFINSNRFNRVNVAAGNNWVHNPTHRGGVPYNNRNVAGRFNGGQNNLVSRPTVGQTQQRLNQMTQRPGVTTQPGQGGRAGMAQGAGSLAGRTPGQGNLAGRGGATPGQGTANRLNQGGLGQPGRGGAPAQGMPNRMSQVPGNNIGNRSMGSGFSGHGAFGGMNQGGARTMMNSNRGFGSRGGGGFRGGGRRR